MNAATVQKLEEVRARLEANLEESDYEARRDAANKEARKGLYPDFDDATTKKIQNAIRDAKAALYPIQQVMHSARKPKLGMRVTKIIDTIETFETALKLGRVK